MDAHRQWVTVKNERMAVVVDVAHAANDVRKGKDGEGYVS